MTQEECLASPHHFVHENICYPGKFCEGLCQPADDGKGEWESLHLTVAPVTAAGHSAHPVTVAAPDCMDACVSRQHHAPVRVLTHIKKLDDCFGQFLVRVNSDCGACREIEPEAPARLVGWSLTLKELAPRMRCSQCGKPVGRTGMLPHDDLVVLIRRWPLKGGPV